MTPCIILGFTANAQPEEKQRCRDAGMNDCLFKPISLTTLEHQLAEITPHSPTRIFDLDGLNALTGGDPLLSQRLLEELLSSSRRDREELMALPLQGARQDLIDQAHKIKGAARIAQAGVLAEQCEVLEQAGEDADLAQFETWVKAIEKAMFDLEQVLQEQLDTLAPL